MAPDDQVDAADAADASDAATGVRLQWRAAWTPPGVATSWSEDEEDRPGAGATDDAAADDPALGVVESDDPAFGAALAVLAADPEFARRRAALSDVDLHVVVRETDEATLAAYPEDGPTTAVVLVVPAADHRADDGTALPEADRVAVHLEAVVTVLVETHAALGLD